MDGERSMIGSKLWKAFVVLLFVFTFANAQDSADKDNFTGPVYKGKEVTRRAKIKSYPAPEIPKDKRAAEVEGQVVLDVVACKDGRITNVEVVQRQPYGTTEAAIKAARKVKFRPAEKDGHVVSQRIRFEYSFRM
jgi:TonB family protein